MGAFELDCNEERTQSQEFDTRRLKEECIIALKVYDSCRQQDCLTEDEIGPARAAEDASIGGDHVREGDIINPPDNAAAVTIDKLRVKRIIIVEKEPNAFKNGFWDIDIKYVFEYRLTFREADGSIIDNIRANSIFNKRVTLFGSIGTDLVIGTDLFRHRHESATIDADPFILVEAKAVSLSAELRYQRCRNIGSEELSPVPNQVAVTIGLFTIIKLFRIVNLLVESKGFCIPEECEEISPFNPCDFFESLDFPMDLFAPPQKKEFLSGVSSNISRRNDDDKPCGC